MYRYPSKEFVLEAISEAAKASVRESSAEHPEDIGTNAAFASDIVAPVLFWLSDNGYLSEKAYE